MPGLLDQFSSLSNPTEEDLKKARSMGLLAAGLGLLSGSAGQGYRPSLGQAIGQGGMQGLGAYQHALEAAPLQRMKSAQVGMQMAEFGEKMKQREQQERLLSGLPPDQQALARLNPSAYIQRKIDLEMPKPVTPPYEAEGLTPEQFRAYKQQPQTPFAAQGMTPEQWRDHLIAQRRAGATKVDVAPKVEVKTGESLAAKIGDIATETRSGALGAVDQIDIANRVRSAIDSGAVVAGPGANVRLKFAQLGQVLNLGGRDTEETIVKTRETIKGLAEASLAARKALKGQGQISDYEGKLLQRAAAGELDDLTVPEIRVVMDVTEKLARKQYAQHKSTIKAMEANPNLQQLVPFYSVPELPAEGVNYPKPPLEAVNTLKMNKNKPRIVEQFEEVFGPGSAQMYLRK